MKNEKWKNYLKSSQYIKKHLLSAGISGNVLLAGVVVAGAYTLLPEPYRCQCCCIRSRNLWGYHLFKQHDFKSS
ncbi:hypothetical protein ACI1UF_09950 [Lactococcus garvieae]|uniref:hypothetical protein n=1 Tax=Lactococcus garvieae TaxID=1363 RepID=UPI00385225FA